MGYYTSYKLEIIEGDDYTTNYKEEIGKSTDGYGDPFGEECKWYEHQKHMKAFSKKYPKTVFKLSGEGEEAGDLWHEYYLNGKMQECKAKIVFDEFNKHLLA